MTEPVEFTLDGRPLSAVAGQSVAAALIDAGVRSWRTTRLRGRPRGVFCGIGVCFDCLITADGRTGVRACLLPVAEGMTLVSETSDSETSDSGAGGDD